MCILKFAHYVQCRWFFKKLWIRSKLLNFCSRRCVDGVYLHGLRNLEHRVISNLDIIFFLWINYRSFWIFTMWVAILKCLCVKNDAAVGKQQFLRILCRSGDWTQHAKHIDLKIYSNQTSKLHRVNLTSVQLLYLGCDLDIKGCLSSYSKNSINVKLWDWFRLEALSFRKKLLSFRKLHRR